MFFLLIWRAPRVNGFVVVVNKKSENGERLQRPLVDGVVTGPTHHGPAGRRRPPGHGRSPRLQLLGAADQSQGHDGPPDACQGRPRLGPGCAVGAGEGDGLVQGGTETVRGREETAQGQRGDAHCAAEDAPGQAAELRKREGLTSHKSNNNNNDNKRL